ncbi:Heat shock protein 14 [Nymphon striatum]|nr:Heat shock protein 14 [Nymphon striatum]
MECTSDKFEYNGTLRQSNGPYKLFIDGVTHVIANDVGDRVTPMCVALTSDDPLVGITAKQQLIRNPQSVITHILAHLDGCQNGQYSKSNCKVIYEESEVHYETICDGKTIKITLTEALTIMFKKMFDIALNQIGNNGSSYDVVLAVPLYFSSDKINSLSSAAVKAGFNVIDTISKPTASILAYNLGQSSKTDDMIILVYRVGGVSTDVAIMRVRSGMYFLVDSHHTSDLGGDLFTEVLVNHLKIEFIKATRMDPSDNKRAMAKLRNSAETCKHVLSTLATAHCSLESLFEGLDLNSNVSRARFESLFSCHMSSYLQPITTILEKLHMDKSSISKVVLSGGTLKMPKFQNEVSALFPNATILNSISSDEVITQGAAVHAAILSEYSDLNAEHPCEIDIFNTNLYAKISTSTVEENYKCILSSGTPVPARRQHQFQVDNNATSCKLDIFSNDCENTKYTQLARIVLTEFSEVKEIFVTVHVRSDGTVHISALEKKSEQCESVVILVNES